MKRTKLSAIVLAAALLLSAAIPAAVKAAPLIPGFRTDGVTALSEYEPQRDGYFAYLPILYYTVPGDLAYSPVEQGDLPVIIYQNKIFVEAYLLMDIAGLDVMIVGDDVTFLWGARRLSASAGRTSAIFTLGEGRTGQIPYIEQKLNLSASPFRGADGGLYVPLTDICCVMGVDLIAEPEENGGGVRYAVNPPQRDVYDVLASFRDDSVREGYIFYYQADQDALEKAEGASRTVLVLDGLLTGDTDYMFYAMLRVMSSLSYIERFMPDQYVWNGAVPEQTPELSKPDKDYWDKILAESLLQKLWFGSENEAAASAETIVDTTSSELGLLLFNGLTDDALSGAEAVRSRLNLLESTFANNSFSMSQRTSLKYQTMLNRYEAEIKAAESKWNLLSAEMTALTVILKTGLAFVNDMTAYEGRDRVIDDALGQFLDYGGYYYLSRAAIQKLEKEYEAYTNDPAMHSFGKALWDSVSEETASAAAGAAFGAASLVLEVYKIATALMPSFQKTKSAMTAYQTSLLAMALERETHDDAFRGIIVNDKENHAALSGKALEDDIRQAYLFFRSCAAARELVQEAFVYSDPLLDTLYAEMTVLARTYGMSEAERPAPYAARFAELGSPDDGIIGQVLPLYLDVSGAVVTFGDEKPVPKAACLVTKHGRQRVDFSADETGRYQRIFIPVFWPESGVTKFDEDFEIELLFYSEQEGTEGEDKKTVAFAPKDSKPVSDAHLLETGSLEASVIDKETKEAIEEPEYMLKLLTPEIYEGVIDVPKSFTGKGDSSGLIRQGKLAPGTWRAVFSKEGYKKETREFEVRSGEVTQLPAPVELEKEECWLLVKEERRDIATGFWSETLSYHYDEEGRLLEVTGSDQDYEARVYDEEGRLIRKIGGTSGGPGAWVSEQYRYDEEGRVTGIVYTSLTLSTARQMSDWQKAVTLGENGRETLRYEGELLRETVRYFADGSVNYVERCEYDEEGRLIRKEITDNNEKNRTYQTLYEYDEEGHLIRETQEGTRGVTILYEYDEEGRLLTERNSYTGYSYRYTYDEHGNRQFKRTYNQSGAMTWEYEYEYRKFPFGDE